MYRIRTSYKTSLIWLLMISTVMACDNNSLPNAWEDFPLASPEAQGFNPEKLAAAERRAGDLNGLQSLIICRNDAIVTEFYDDGVNQKMAFNIKSVSKSFLSALVGIALHEGTIDSLEQTLYGFFPEYFQEGDDPAKRTVTLRHLVTMTAGFQWTENGPETAGWMTSSNWNEFFINLPLIKEPGTFFIYSTGGTHAVSSILTKASGISTRDYAQTRLFEPAGITVSRWDRDPQGYYFGGSEMYCTVRDMIRFGVLYLNEGKRGSRQVVPAEWVRESIREQIHLERTGYTAYFLDRGFEGYGYGWWRRQSAGYDVFFASGYGGQLIIVVQDLDLVAAITSSLQVNTSQTALLRHEVALFSLLDDILNSIVEYPPSVLRSSGERITKIAKP